MAQQPTGDQPPAFSFPGGQAYSGQQPQSGRNFSRPAGGGTAVERPQQVVRRGRNWARISLIASAVFLLYTVVSIDNVATFMSSGAAGFASGLMWIAQLPLLIGALWLLFRPAANQYFRKPRA